MQQRQELEPVAHLLWISQHAVAVKELSSDGGVITACQQNLSETTRGLSGQNMFNIIPIEAGI